MGERVRLDTGDAMLLDAIGAQVARLHATDGSDDVGIVLDLEGKLNKLQVRDAHRYLLTAGQAAELIAELVVSAQQAVVDGSPLEITRGQSFAAELDAAIAREQTRRGLRPGSTR